MVVLDHFDPWSQRCPFPDGRYGVKMLIPQEGGTVLHCLHSTDSYLIIENGNITFHTCINENSYGTYSVCHGLNKFFWIERYSMH